MNLDIQLTPHFHLREFFHTEHNPDKLVQEFKSLPGLRQGELVDNIRQLAAKLEPVRVMNQQAMDVESGWRSWRLHAEVYRELGQKPPTYSEHLQGLAADFLHSCLSPGIVTVLWRDWQGGMGKYSWGIHLDIGRKRRWSN